MKLFYSISFLFFGISLTSSLSINAQTTLPYFCGFDTPTQTSGWVEYKTAATQPNSWGSPNVGTNAYSPSGYISHDYSPSTGVGLKDNWFVSPAFSLPNGGQMDSIRYKFSGFSVPNAGDTVAIYLLTGSQDPALATSKQLLFDFRGTNYVADNTYRIQTNIALPASSGFSYFAVRYRNSNSSAQWISVYFDNIAISGNAPVGISETDQKASTLFVYPNPSNGIITVDSDEEYERIEIYNLVGEKIHSGNYQKEINFTHYPEGIYFLSIQKQDEIYLQKIIKN